MVTTVANTFIVDVTIVIKEECFKLLEARVAFFKWIFLGIPITKHSSQSLIHHTTLHVNRVKDMEGKEGNAKQWDSSDNSVRML